MSKALHTSYNLYIAPEVYTFEPVVQSASEPNETLVIDRRTGSITLNPSKTRAPAVAHERVITVYGIMGILSLSTADFLIVITGRARHGRLIGSEIYLATDFKVLPIESSPAAASSALLDHPVEKRLLLLVKQHLDSGKFWFSYGWDLTRRLQVQRGAAEEEGTPMWELADDRFFWNRYLHDRFIDITKSNPDQDLSRFILPVMYGSFDIRPASINGRPFLFCLISRRSRHRAGTRYFARGIDADGHVANFNESEQIVLLDPEGVQLGGGRIEGRTRLSFVQTRGSTPIYWAEVNNLRYRPDLQIMELPDTVGALRKHLQELTRIYGEVYLVNLVNQKGHEKPVKDAYERYVREASQPLVKYEYFDFHHECRNMRWDRIQLLIDRLEPALKEKGYFHQDLGNPTPIKVQTAVVRSNCMDCLDRTNVVQSALAKWSLTQQLRAAGLMHKEERLDDHADFMTIFREVWADHADAISTAYAGTGALKTDFTRTGRRTREGALHDGWNSVQRYVRNNYFDGPRQDAYDLFTGNWKARRGGGAWPNDTRPLLVRSMPYVLLFAICMILASIGLPRSSTSYSLIWFLLLQASLLSGALYFIAQHGVDYVAWPRLNPPLEMLHYDGPGFREKPKGRGIAVPPIGLAMNVRSSVGAKMEEIEMGTKKRTRMD